jgi:hypothetical protein
MKIFAFLLLLLFALPVSAGDGSYSRPSKISAWAVSISVK